MSFAIRGLIEGFYDRLWTWEERRRVAAFVAAGGFDTYVYASKTDRLQNGEWRRPYPEEHRAALASFGDACHELRMAYWIGLRPVGISYADPADADALVAKLSDHLALGADRLLILADDIPFELDDSGAARFRTLADAHTWLVELALARLGLAPELVAFCPTEYHGGGSDYLAALGEELPERVDLCWTGPEVCSPTITAADVERLTRLLQRPPLIWDNYPVNDALMLGELHLGPVRGRAPDLAAHVRGVMVNPAIEPEATLIPLSTCAEYLRDPAGYDPDAAWWRALTAVAGEAGADVATLAAASDRSVIEQGWRRPSADQLHAAQAGLRGMANRRLATDLEPFLDGR